MNDKPITEHPDVQRLIRQVTELQKNLEVWREACGINEKRIEEFQAEIKRMEKALERYGHHDSPCAALIDDEICPCFCGYEQALKGNSNDR